MRGEKKRIEEKSLFLLQSFFVVTLIRMIWLDVFAAQMNRKKKRLTVSFQSTYRQSMVAQSTMLMDAMVDALLLLDHRLFFEPVCFGC